MRTAGSRSRSVGGRETRRKGIKFKLGGFRVFALSVTKLRPDNYDPRKYFRRLKRWRSRVEKGGGHWQVINNLETPDEPMPAARPRRQRPSPMRQHRLRTFSWRIGPPGRDARHGQYEKYGLAAGTVPVAGLPSKCLTFALFS